MQNTRLSTIVNASVERLSRWSRNPWRRISLIVISLLSGFFLASIISTVSGVKSEQDAISAGIVLLVVEFISRYVYGMRRESNRTNETSPLTPEILNSLKLGLIYGLFLEAFKLGS